MPSVRINHSIPHTPQSVSEFSKEWLRFILDDWFHKTHENATNIDITSFSASKNNLQVNAASIWWDVAPIFVQGQLSTTYIVDIKYLLDKTEEEEKSIFVKVPLSGPGAQNFQSVREGNI